MTRHIIFFKETIREALKRLDVLGADAILFIVDENNKLVGSLTDGDLRRGFIKGLGFEDSLLEFVQPNPSFIRENENAVEKLEEYKNEISKLFRFLITKIKL
ncbi:CBS domain-containing protein [Niabella sp. W65]|nr:CBS domain-containing protein [Niabella sp. W65]MCH7365030.1 CBS domain-containing protein [Niabella sp. W65]